MSKNNKEKSSIGLVSAIVIVIGVLVLGYFLFKTSPKSSNLNSYNQNQNSTSNGVGLDSLVGKPLPNIQLTDKDGKVYTNENFKGKNTVLFFSEGLMCYPACWNQVAALGSDSRFNTDQTQAFSVLMDSSTDWQRAIDKMPELAKSNTLFDVGGTVSRSFGLLTLPSSMHRGVLPGHTYIIVDKAGIVRYVNDDPNMAIANDSLISKMAEFK